MDLRGGGTGANRCEAAAVAPAASNFSLPDVATSDKPLPRLATRGLGVARRKRTHNFPRSKLSPALRGYDATHVATRRWWKPIVEAGGVDCVRCGLPIARGSRWHLDHRDDGGGYLGPAHAKCNLRAAAKLGNQRMRQKKALEKPQDTTRVRSREW